MPSLPELLQRDVAAICYPQGRMVGSQGHKDARHHLSGRLKEIGCQPFIGDSFELPYRSGRQDFCNLAGLIPGRNSALAPLLIGAHYDSVIHHPCADDNAAAVAIALQASSILQTEATLERDLIVAIFDAEEPPYFHSEAMGSNRFYEDHILGSREIHAALVMDLVGHDVCLPVERLAEPGMEQAVADLRSLLFVTGTESHPELAQVITTLGQPQGLRVIPTLNSYVGDMSDHGIFRRHGVPYYFLSCGTWEHYHMPTDTPDRLNYAKMAAITHYVVALLSGQNHTPLANRTGVAQIHDTLALECCFLRDALGSLHQPMLDLAKLNGLTSRKDMDRFTRMLLSMGLG
jgi:hypothetical protein